MVDLQPSTIREELTFGEPFIADPGEAAPSYARALQGLLPRGRLWRRAKQALGNWWNLFLGMGREPAIFNSRVVDVLDRELDPARTQEMLGEWEALTGLPDPCLPATADVVLRRNRLVRKLSGARGQSRQHFTELLEGLGYSVKIIEYKPFRVGESTAGTPLYGEDWTHVWDILVDLTQSAGEAVSDPEGAAILCLIQSLQPAHSVVHVYFGDVQASTIEESLSFGAPILSTF